MTTAVAGTGTGTGQRATTPTAGGVFKRALFWIAAAVFILVVGIISVGLAGNGVAGPPLSSTNPAAAGAKAVAEVLRQQGVTVTAADSLDEARSAIGDAGDTTLLLYDPDLYLTDSQLRTAAGLAADVVLVDANFSELQVLAPGVAQAGTVKGTLKAGCDLRPATQAKTISGGGNGYRVTGDDLDATTCFGSGDRVFSVIQLPRADGTLTLLGATNVLSNEGIVEKGNAALALGLLGGHHDLVWYIPTAADLPAPEAGQDLASLTPAWVIPVMSLLAIVFVVAAVWRGRRLGPLVVENLPVTVRASETMRGRARLYEKSTSRVRAVDSLRIGAIGRLAVLCGLPRVATVDEVVAAVASVTGRQGGEVRRMLIDDIPPSDRELVALSDALLVLERDVARALRPDAPK